MTNTYAKIGSLSMMGASIIIYRYVTMKPNLRNVYHRLLFGMSIMNFFGSFGYFLSTWPINYPVPAPNGFCSFQGWLIQINAAVYFYNGYVFFFCFVFLSTLCESDCARKTYCAFFVCLLLQVSCYEFFVANQIRVYGRPNGENRTDFSLRSLDLSSDHFVCRVGVRVLQQGRALVVRGRICVCSCAGWIDLVCVCVVEIVGFQFSTIGRVGRFFMAYYGRLCFIPPFVWC